MEAHPFHLQAQALLHTRFKPQFDGPARAKHAVPRQAFARLRAQQARHRAMVQRVARRRGGFAIRTHPAGWNRKHNTPERFIPQIVWPQAIAKDRSPGLPG